MPEQEFEPHNFGNLVCITCSKLARIDVVYPTMNAGADTNVRKVFP
jgi:hypothetical protein